MPNARNDDLWIFVFGHSTGGLDLGLERAGMTCSFQVEIDPFCQKVLTKHWPEVPKYGDVRELSGRQLPPVDLLCGGFPCQPVSTAGRRKGLDDARWLWPEFARLVGEMGPRYVLVENVPGLLSKGGWQVLSDLAEMGFDAEWGVVAAATVGAPHRRERVFVIAYASGSQLRDESGGLDGAGREGEAELGNNGKAGLVAEPYSPRRGNTQEGSPRGRLTRLRPAKDFAFVGSRGSKFARRRASLSEWWAVEPDVGRVAHGIPKRVDRLRALGNAVVPQWAELMGQMILDHAR